MVISEDKKTITLKVPLDAKLYKYHTTCCDLCAYDRKAAAAAGITLACSSRSVCHTKPYGIDIIRHSLRNIESVDKDLGVTIFETEEEARQAMEDYCKANVKKLRDAGIPMNDDGTYAGEVS